MMKTKKGKAKDIKLDVAEAKRRYLIHSREFREKRLRITLGKKKQPFSKVPKLVNYGYTCSRTRMKPIWK